MTLIAAISDGKQVWMGSDSFVGNGEYALTVARPKVFRRIIKADNKPLCDVLIGHCGDFRGGSILQRVELPEYSCMDDLDDWIFKFTEQVRAAFTQYGYAVKEKEQQRQDLHILIGIMGRIFSIWDWYDTVENAGDYMAIGSGMYFALGAFHATNNLLLEPEARLLSALEAASTHNVYVCPPFHAEVA